MLGITSFAINETRGMRTAVGCLSALSDAALAGPGLIHTHDISPQLFTILHVFQVCSYDTNKTRNLRHFDHKKQTRTKNTRIHTRFLFFRLVLFTHTLRSIPLPQRQHTIKSKQHEPPRSLYQVQSVSAPAGDYPSAQGLPRPRRPLEQDRARSVALETGPGFAGDDVIHFLPRTHARTERERDRKKRNVTKNKNERDGTSANQNSWT